MFIAKKSCYLLGFCTLISLFVFSGKALPAYAAPVRVVASSVRSSVSLAGRAQREKSAWYRLSAKWQKPAHHFWGRPFQENIQVHRGISESRSTTSTKGHDQLNTGNHGWNSGFTFDHFLNSGNQIISRKAHAGRNVQYFSGESGSRNHFFFRGWNQGNSGNSGVNRGRVEDSARNTGNQILD